MDDDLQQTSDERLWATLAHASMFVPAVSIIAPLLIWLCHDAILKRKSRFVEHHGKQALAFQIAIVVIIFIVVFATCGFGAVIAPVIAIASLILAAMAAVAANKGEWYTYPGLSIFGSDGQ